MVPPVFSRNPNQWLKLKDKHLLIVGLGSVGSAVALMAARAGIGQFNLFDHSILEPGHLGRHLCTTVGSPKARAVRELILQVNPEAVVTTNATDFRKLVHEGLTISPATSLLIGATDSFECQSLLNTLSLETGVPAVFVGCWGAATIGEILFLRPGKTACYNCYAAFRRSEEPLAEPDSRKYFDPDFDSTRVPSQAGLWANILIVSGFAFQIILALTGGDRVDFLDDAHNLFLVNVGDSQSGLPLWAVSMGHVNRGCEICDESWVYGS